MDLFGRKRKKLEKARKETAFDREVVRAYDYAKSAVAEPSSV